MKICSRIWKIVFMVYWIELRTWWPKLNFPVGKKKEKNVVREWTYYRNSRSVNSLREIRIRVEWIQKSRNDLVNILNLTWNVEMTIYDFGFSVVYFACFMEITVLRISQECVSFCIISDLKVQQHFLNHISLVSW